MELEEVIAAGKAPERAVAAAHGSSSRSNRCEEFVIGGYTPGNPFDALIVGCYDGTELKFVAKVRSGFVPRVRREVFQRFAGFETEKCPFTNLPENQRTQWALTAH